MSITERRDAAERIASLERQATRVTRYEGRRSDVIVPVQNLSGADLEHGSAVSISDIGSDGVLEVAKPSVASDPAFVGYVVGKLLAGAIGRCQVAGIAEAIRDKTTSSPAAGADMGTLESSAVVSSDQVGAGKFIADLKDLGYTGICLVLLQHGDRLVVDHDAHVDSTTVTESGEGVGALHDVWKVKKPLPQTQPAYVKLMSSIAGKNGHDEGWVWGEEHSQYGNPGYGWGTWADVFGMEQTGYTLLNIRTDARFNDSLGRVAPIHFTGAGVHFEPTGGNLTKGEMVFDATLQRWRPAIRMDTVKRRDCHPASPMIISNPCDCNCLNNPLDYQMVAPEVIGPVRQSDSFDNYLAHICCLIDRQNLIFRLLYVMDCCYGNRWGSLDAWMLTNFTSAGGSAPGVTYPDVIQCLVAQVFGVTAVNCGTVVDWGTLCTDIPYKEDYYKNLAGACPHDVGQ